MGSTRSRAPFTGALRALLSCLICWLRSRFSGAVSAGSSGRESLARFGSGCAGASSDACASVTGMIGVGIVGLSAAGGWAAGAHVPALSSLDGIELRGLVGSSAASGQAASKVYGVRAYESVGALADEVDLVVIAVKVARHRELVLSALATEAAVFCEWPLAKDLREAEELERAAARTRSFVGLQGRTLPVFRSLRDLVSERYVGEVLST